VLYASGEDGVNVAVKLVKVTEPATGETVVATPPGSDDTVTRGPA
jgi:hypothetical protein